MKAAKQDLEALWYILTCKWACDIATKRNIFIISFFLNSFLCGVLF